MVGKESFESEIEKLKKLCAQAKTEEQFEEVAKEVNRLYNTQAKTEEQFEEVAELGKQLEKAMKEARMSLEVTAENILLSLWGWYCRIKKAETPLKKGSAKFLYHKVLE